jgi:hypothetical protein
MVTWITKELQVLVFQIFQNQRTMGSGCASLKQSESKNHWSNSKILKNLPACYFDFFKHLRTVIMYINWFSDFLRTTIMNP